MGSFYDQTGKMALTYTISADPLFVNLPGRNLRLTPPTLGVPGSGSPCIDTARDSRWPNDWVDINDDNVPDQSLPLDYDLNDRGVDNPHVTSSDVLDMGAFEVGGSSVPPGGN